MADPSAQTYDDASLPGMMGAPVAVTPTEGGYVGATGRQYVPASPTEPGAVRGVSDAGVAPKGAPKTYADTELPGLLPGGVTTAAEDTSDVRKRAESSREPVSPLAQLGSSMQRAISPPDLRLGRTSLKVRDC